jgi:hypothetical protein
VGRITKFDPSDFPTTIAAEIKGFVAEDHVDKKEVKRMDPFIHLAMASTHFAMADSGLTIDEESAPRVGVDQSVLHPDAHLQSRPGTYRDPVRGEGPQHHDDNRLRRVQPRDRGSAGGDPPGCL